MLRFIPNLVSYGQGMFQISSSNIDNELRYDLIVMDDDKDHASLHDRT